MEYQNKLAVDVWVLLAFIDCCFQHHLISYELQWVREKLFVQLW
jgi:hypothetical protein